MLDVAAKVQGAAGDGIGAVLEQLVQRRQHRRPPLLQVEQHLAPNK